MRMTEAEFKALGRHPLSPLESRDNPLKKTAQKYKNQRVTTEAGLNFDSKAEHKFWLFLKIRERAKEIFNLERQVAYEIIPAVMLGGKKRPARKYIADMRWNEGSRTGPLVVADVKGAVTAEYSLKRHLMAHVHGIEIREIRA
jgi:hypothetical protein